MQINNSGLWSSGQEYLIFRKKMIPGIPQNAPIFLGLLFRSSAFANLPDTIYFSPDQAFKAIPRHTDIGSNPGDFS